MDKVAFSVDVTFQKDAAGESTVVGQFVNESGIARGIGRIHGGRVYAYQADSHERAQQRGRQDIAQLVDQLAVRPREDTIEAAHRLYKLALQRGFTRGRRTNQVAAACLYLFCRQDEKPFLLIDFSDALQVNVFTLGAVFLQLAKLLRLEDHPLFSKPVDPSLYIHRFADRMDLPSRELYNKVSETAMRLVASMRRDWIQTGRRPSGVCGAALYIAAHLHGCAKTKREIVSVVHIGEHTLSKRLSEFATTEAGLMTGSQFEKHAKAIEALEQEALTAAAPDQEPRRDLLVGCEHLSHGEAHFKNGMCRKCFEFYFNKTGGTFDGANPPAYSKARSQELKKQSKQAHLLALPAPDQQEFQSEDEDNAEDRGGMRRPVKRSKRVMQSITAALIEAAEKEVEDFDSAIAQAEAAEQRKNKRRRMSTAAVIAAATAEAVYDAAEGLGEEGGQVANQGQRFVLKGGLETSGRQEDGEEEELVEEEDGREETLSDISESEIEIYIADEKEVLLKEELWNMMNQDWVEKQAAKKEALKAAEKAQEEQRAAMEAAAAAGIQYKRGRGRPLGSKTKPKPDSNLPPAETPQEAAMRMLNNKKLSSKINYSALANLFSDDPAGDEGEEQGGGEQEHQQEQQEQGQEQEHGQRKTSNRRAGVKSAPPSFSAPPSRQKKQAMGTQRNTGSPEKKEPRGKASNTHQSLVDALDIVSAKTPKKSILGFRPLGASALPGGSVVQGRLGGLGDDVGLFGPSGSRGPGIAPSLPVSRQRGNASVLPTVPSPPGLFPPQPSKAKAKRKVRFAE